MKVLTVDGEMMLERGKFKRPHEKRLLSCRVSELRR